MIIANSEKGNIFKIFQVSQEDIFGNDSFIFIYENYLPFSSIQFSLVNSFSVTPIEKDSSTYYSLLSDGDANFALFQYSPATHQISNSNEGKLPISDLQYLYATSIYVDEISADLGILSVYRSSICNLAVQLFFMNTNGTIITQYNDVCVESNPFLISGASIAHIPMYSLSQSQIHSFNSTNCNLLLYSTNSIYGAILCFNSTLVISTLIDVGEAPQLSVTTLGEQTLV